MSALGTGDTVIASGSTDALWCVRPPNKIVDKRLLNVARLYVDSRLPKDRSPERLYSLLGWLLEVLDAINDARRKEVCIVLIVNGKS